MIRYLVYRIKLSRLFRKREVQENCFAKIQSDLEKRKATQMEREGLHHEERTELSIIDFDIERLTTAYYMKVARMEFIDVPGWEDEKGWIESSLDPQRKVLSNAAIGEIKSKIAKHQKEQNDLWISKISALTGLIGVIIGLVALFLE